MQVITSRTSLTYFHPPTPMAHVSAHRRGYTQCVCFCRRHPDLHPRLGMHAAVGQSCDTATDDIQNTNPSAIGIASRIVKLPAIILRLNSRPPHERVHTHPSRRMRSDGGCVFELCRNITAHAHTSGEVALTFIMDETTRSRRQRVDLFYIGFATLRNAPPPSAHPPHDCISSPICATHHTCVNHGKPEP